MSNKLSNKEILAKNLNKYMNLNGIDRNKICDDLKIPYTTFTDWYKGVTYPSMDKIEILANYFNIMKYDLIEDIDRLGKEVKMYEYLDKIDKEELKLIDNDVDFIEKYKILFDKDNALTEEQKKFMINFIKDQHDKIKNNLNNN